MVEQSPDGSANWQQIASLSGAATAFTATGPFVGSTTYYFRVRTDSSVGGDSPYSSILSVTTPAYPGQPTLTSATAQSDTAVALSWTAVSTATGYEIERRLDSGSTWMAVDSVTANAATYTDVGLTEGTFYTYRVVATNAAGDSAPSVSQSVTTLPAAPTGLIATMISGGQVNLSWTNQSAVATIWRIDESTDGTNWSVFDFLSGSGVDNDSATGRFDDSTTYYFRICAGIGNVGYSTYATVSVTTPNYPDAPVIVSGTAESNGDATLTWTDVAGETGFRVERRVGSSGNWTVAGVVSAGVTTFTDTGLNELSNYQYRVIAASAVGDSAPSESVSVYVPYARRRI